MAPFLHQMPSNARVRGQTPRPRTSSHPQSTPGVKPTAGVLQAVIRVSQLRKGNTYVWASLHRFQEQPYSACPSHDIRIQQKQKFSLRLFESDIGCGTETDVCSILNGSHPRFAQSLKRSTM